MGVAFQYFQDAVCFQLFFQEHQSFQVSLRVGDIIVGKPLGSPDTEDVEKGLEIMGHAVLIDAVDEVEPVLGSTDKGDVVFAGQRA